MKPLFRPTCPICGCDAESFFRQEHGFHLVEFYECAERANDCRPFAIVFAPTSLSVAYPYTAKKPEAFDVARGAADVRCPGCHAVLNLNGPLEGEHFPEQWEAWCSTENCQTNEYRIELTQRSIQTINFSSKDAEAFAGEFEEFEAWLNGDGPAEWEVAQAAERDPTTERARRFRERKSAAEKLRTCLTALGYGEHSPVESTKSESAPHRGEHDTKADDDLPF